MIHRRPNEICPELLTNYRLLHPDLTLEEILDNEEHYQEIRCLGKGIEGTDDDEKNKGKKGCMLFDYSSGKCRR